MKKKFLKICCFFPRMIQRIRIALRKNGRYKYGISIVAIVKNEGDYILEWIRYHKIIGIDHFYIFNNESTDNTVACLERYVDDGTVTLIDFPGKARQLPAYNYAIKHYKNESEYMAFIDVDEFIHLVKQDKDIYPVVKNILNKDKHAGGLAINWCMFGSSGYITKPASGGVLENYLYRASDDFPANQCIKTIANPRTIFNYVLSHYPIYCLGFHSIDENGNVVTGWSNKLNYIKEIKLNHYFTKSKEEWIRRRRLGKAEGKSSEIRTMDEFDQHDKNDVYDDAMLKYVDQIFNID